MKRENLWTAGLVLLIAGLILVGCSDEDHDGMLDSDDEVVSIASITPSDGTSGVSPSSVIGIAFTGPVDTTSVMSNFHLAGGQPMHQWRDSLQHHGGFGMMHMGMEEHMMAWMDSIHVPGEFHWNERLDSCEFVPDSMLMAGTDYLCLLYEGGMRDRHGHMIGGDNHQDTGYHMYNFSTGP